MQAVRDRGPLATITSDPPAAMRDITVRAAFVAPDGSRLGGLVQLLAQGVLTVWVGERFPLSTMAPRRWPGSGTARRGSAVVLQPGDHTQPGAQSPD